MVGKTVSHYRILEKLGAGGMGEVYRAHDTRLGRDVAIKVLPEAFANDRERLARFEREAQVLAALNHPHIASIHGLEDSSGTPCLVMELVEGPTLVERLGRGPLPVKEALELAHQIAEALEAAHEKGIIHRDLKPQNVKVTREGAIKVLDFGLAKAREAEVTESDLSQSPTLSAAATRAGTILGTAAYMSPEQARGKAIDKRADIWAFGCVLFELLTGKKAFSGETVSDTLASIIKPNPEWDLLPTETPPAIRELLERCLEKDSKRRLRDIGEARITIEKALAEPTPVGRPTVLAVARRRSRWTQVLPWGLAGLLSLILIGVISGGPRRSSRSIPPRAVRFSFSLALPAGLDLSGGVVPLVSVSPDGSRLAYVGRDGERSKLYLRDLDRLEPRPIAGTDGATAPFFSPDGQWIGFFADGKLKKVAVTGGPVLTLANAMTGGGAAWWAEDTIVFSGDTFGGLSKISAAGGKPQVLTTPDPKRGEYWHVWPEFLPGGQGVLFTIGTGVTFENARIAALSLKTGEQKTLIEGAMNPHYLPTGQLIYAQQGAILAAPFDLGRLAVTGPPTPILEGVMIDLISGVAQLSVSAQGTIAYIPGHPVLAENSLVSVDRNGVARELAKDRRPYEDLSLSPDGTRVAMTIMGPTWNVWVFDLARGTLTRLTFEGDNRDPEWTPDGKRIVYTSFRDGRYGLYWRPPDGSGTEELLTRWEHWVVAWSFSPDGEFLAFYELDPTTRAAMWLLPLRGDRKAQLFLRTGSVESFPMFSRDGHWIAYESDETGRSEVYVRPFPGPGGKWQVSTDGGEKPVWARNGRELFYRNGNKMMAAPVETKPAFKAGTPRVLFEKPYWQAGHDYDVTPDGQHFIMIKRSEQQEAPVQVNVVVNWFEELKRQAPGGHP
jgi:serine/threonine-protein kinase